MAFGGHNTSSSPATSLGMRETLALKVEWEVGRNKWSAKKIKKQRERDKENNELESEKGRSKSRI